MLAPKCSVAGRFRVCPALVNSCPLSHLSHILESTCTYISLPLSYHILKHTQPHIPTCTEITLTLNLDQSNTNTEGDSGRPVHACSKQSPTNIETYREWEYRKSNVGDILCTSQEFMEYSNRVWSKVC